MNLTDKLWAIAGRVAGDLGYERITGVVAGVVLDSVRCAPPHNTFFAGAMQKCQTVE